MRGGGLLTWHMIDGFSVFLFFVSSSGGDWWCCGEQKKRDSLQHSWSWGRRVPFVSVCLEKKTNSLYIVGSLTQRGSRACVKNVQVHKGATELRNGKQMCLGMGTRYECCEMW